MSIRLVQFLRKIFYRFLSDNAISTSPSIRQPLLLTGKGSIHISDGSQIGYASSPKFLSSYAYIEARKKDSSINIKCNTVINNGVSIIAYRDKIIIGERCVIGVNVQIMNSDFHKINKKDRFTNNEPRSSAIEIGNDVFIGNNVMILKGVKIGSGSTIASGSIVRDSIPPDSIYNEQNTPRIKAIT